MWWVDFVASTWVGSWPFIEKRLFIYLFILYIRYSWNNGETWTSLKFTDRKIWVYGLLTEPGEKTTVFSIFGSYAEKHEWLIVQVNLSSIFSKYIFYHLY